MCNTPQSTSINLTDTTLHAISVVYFPKYTISLNVDGMSTYSLRNTTIYFDKSNSSMPSGVNFIKRFCASLFASSGVGLNIDTNP